MDNDSTVFIGLDVHKDSIAVARVGSATRDPVIDVATIGTQQYAIERMLAQLAGHGPLQFVYEAGPCGYWLHRYLTGKGQRCLVAAPSLVPRRPGDRIKTDRRDARNLALGCAPARSPRCTSRALTRKRSAMWCAPGNKPNATSPRANSG